MACLFVPVLTLESSQECRADYADPRHHWQIDFGQLPEIGWFLQGRVRIRLLHPLHSLEDEVRRGCHGCHGYVQDEIVK